MEYQIQRGGWYNGHDDRLAVSQRPADGHIKAAIWEDATHFHMPCNKGTLEVGDIIFLHTTLTLGFVTGYGISIESPVEGLKMKLVSREGNDLSLIKAKKSTYDDENEMFTSEDFDFSSGEFGDENAWYGGVVENLNDIFIENTDLIGVEITELPDDFDPSELRFVSRIHFTQPVRPPANLKCCGDWENTGDSVAVAV